MRLNQQTRMHPSSAVSGSGPGATPRLLALSGTNRDRFRAPTRSRILWFWRARVIQKRQFQTTTPMRPAVPNSAGNLP